METPAFSVAWMLPRGGGDGGAGDGGGGGGRGDGGGFFGEGGGGGLGREGAEWDRIGHLGSIAF